MVIEALRARIETVPLAQLLRYGLAGALATLVDLAVFYLMANFVLPCLDPALGDAVRARRFVVDTSVAFVIANAFCYWLNARWVFTRGRHRRAKEIALFFAVSLVSYAAGTLLGRLLIGQYGLSTHVAKFGAIATSALLNYVCRKFIVFKN